MSRQQSPSTAITKPLPDSERTPLLDARDPPPGPSPDEEASRVESHDESTQKPVSIISIVAVFLIGVFVSNADVSFVLATHGTIASEFDKLSASSWLISSYTLATCTFQPIYGKISDLYGRKSVLTVAYVLFAVGCAICGVATSFAVLLLGRVISGIGSGGIYAMMTVIITDLVPLREVASWRSYLNIAATSGRSLGGPIGGYLADTIGWRISFGSQSPLIVVAIILSWILVPPRQPESTGDHQKQRSRLARIDFLGILFLALTVLTFLMPLTLGGQRIQWSHPLIIGSFGCCIFCSYLFVATEKHWATEPIFPLHLLKNRAVVTAYLAFTCQILAQTAMMFSVPIYFQVTARVSSTVAGLHLVPAFFGNVAGGLTAGFAIRRTGRYKLLAIIAAISSSVSYLLLMLRWHGRTNAWESLYIVPGGFGMGLTEGALFISLNAGLDPSYNAVAISGLLLCASVGLTLGVSMSSVVLTATLRKLLMESLRGIDGADKIIDRAASDISYVMGLQGRLRDIIVDAYVRSLEYCHGFSLAFAIATLLVSLFLRERKL